MDGMVIEWTVTVRAERDLPVSEDAIDLISDALNSDPAALRLSMRFDVPTPILAATLLVRAESADEAADAGVSAFANALESAGVGAQLGVADVVRNAA